MITNMSGHRNRANKQDFFHEVLCEKEENDFSKTISPSRPQLSRREAPPTMRTTTTSLMPTSSSPANRRRSYVERTVPALGSPGEIDPVRRRRSCLERTVPDVGSPSEMDPVRRRGSYLERTMPAIGSPSEIDLVRRRGSYLERKTSNKYRTGEPGETTPWEIDSVPRRHLERTNSSKYRPVLPMDIDCGKTARLLPYIPFVTAIVFLIAIFSIYHTSSVQQNINSIINQSGSQVDILQSSISSMDADLEQHRSTMKDLEEANDALFHYVEDLKKQDLHLRSINTESLEKSTDVIARENKQFNSELPLLRNRQAFMSRKVKALVDKIQRDSYRDSYEKFGPGPHRVEFTVELPGLPGFTNNHAFVIELAPLAKMPHSVHLFLEQVSHELWDDCAFAFNAPHVIQAGAYPVTTGKSYEDKMNEFDEIGLSTVHFQEYNDQYPHKQWTVGFADYGPNFYINMIDNTENHGPRSKGDELFDNAVDPCFGEIVEGQKTIEMMRSLPLIYSLPEDEHFVLENPVHIVKARIMGIETNQRGNVPHDMKDKHFNATS